MTPSTTATKLCAVCRHAVDYGPMMCRRFTADDTSAPRLTHVLRASDGLCGVDGAFFEPCTTVSADVLPFPKPHRVSA